MVAGAVGASGRLSYTVYGDAVNLAARLEALNREHGTAVLLCGETAGAAEDLPIEPAGAATVRGQSVPTRLFTVREETDEGTRATDPEERARPDPRENPDTGKSPRRDPGLSRSRRTGAAGGRARRAPPPSTTKPGPRSGGRNVQ